MFRHGMEDNAFYSMNRIESQHFYNKIVKLRGTFKKIHNAGGHYLGMRINGGGEEWSVFRELVSVTSELDVGKPIYFIDENREVETWLFEILKPRLNSTDINIISSDLDEIVHYSGWSGDNYLG